jgi:hypothetical protein
MFSLEDLLGQAAGNSALGQISQQVGADSGLTSKVISMALPAILGGLTKQASNPETAGGLANALTNDHDGSILDNLGGFFGGQTAPSPQTDGGGILSHIFGSQQGQVTEQISQNSGMGIGQVAQILMTLAPLVMGFFGKQQSQQGLNQGGIMDMIMGTQQRAQSSGNPMMDLASSFLDSDHDGSAMDDIASMALKYMTNR